MHDTSLPAPADHPPPHGVFRHPLRVYWEDTDAGGVVFYANYLKFFERARTEWLRELGIGQQRVAAPGLLHEGHAGRAALLQGHGDVEHIVQPGRRAVVHRGVGDDEDGTGGFAQRLLAHA